MSYIENVLQTKIYVGFLNVGFLFINFFVYLHMIYVYVHTWCKAASDKVGLMFYHSLAYHLR